MKNILKWVLTTIICATYPVFILASKGSLILKACVVSLLFMILAVLWREKLMQIKNEQKVALKIYDILFFFLCFIIYTVLSVGIPLVVFMIIAVSLGITH